MGIVAGLTALRRSASVAPILLLLAGPAAAAQLASAWNETGTGPGRVQVSLARPPWAARRASLALSRDPVLHYHRGRLFVLGRADGTLSMLVPARRRRASLLLAHGAAAAFEDVVATAAKRVYLTRRNANTLLRVDLESGETTPVADLGAFADADGIADLGAMIEHEGRLFVQVRRFNENAPQGHAAPAFLAVVDLASETVVDVDPATPGVQAIELAGTAPKHRMQILPEVRRLYVSASGGFFDQGGLEAIDLDALRSAGLIVREADGQTGADLGPFVMVTPERGFLAYSTDLDLSSHVQPFTVRDGVPVRPEIHVTVGYAMPTLVYDRDTDTLFVPDGAFGREGVFAYDATSEERRQREPVAGGGSPTDVLLLRR